MNDAVYGCEVLFSADQARQVQDLVQGATGMPCPCQRGIPCPLLPRDGGVMLGTPALRSPIEAA